MRGRRRRSRKEIKIECSSQQPIGCMKTVGLSLSPSALAIVSHSRLDLSLTTCVCVCARVPLCLPREMRMHACMHACRTREEAGRTSLAFLLSSLSLSLPSTSRLAVHWLWIRTRPEERECVCFMLKRSRFRLDCRFRITCWGMRMQQKSVGALNSLFQSPKRMSLHRICV